MNYCKKNINAESDFNIVVFASGGGGNFQALIDECENVGYNIILLVVDRDCGAMDRAKSNNIPYILIEKKKIGESFFGEIEKSVPSNTDLIVLAGFLSIISKKFCQKWEGRIINTHPSLLPKYGGKGMVGVRVQESVMQAKEQKAGCTVHYVTAEIDGGKIIIQREIDVNYDETPWELGGRVHEEEKKALLMAIKMIMDNFKKGIN